MKIIIDEGNTNVKIAVYQLDNLLELIIITISELEDNVLALYQKYPIRAMIVSSVGKHAYNVVKKMDLPKVVFVERDLPVPFQNLYQTPHTLGFDRIALVVAAVSQFPNSNVLVIDAGTCVTYDFVDEKRNYHGGAISPGLQMRLKAMHHYTAKLPLITISKEVSSFIGRNTNDSLQIGAVLGLANEIDGFINMYTQNYDNLKVVLTGGDAINLCKQLKSTIFVRPNFLLDGLNSLLTYQLENEIQK